MILTKFNEENKFSESLMLLKHGTLMISETNNFDESIIYLVVEDH